MDMLEFLRKNISIYAVSENNTKEILPEILAKDNSDRNEFTYEFIKELRRRSR